MQCLIRYTNVYLTIHFGVIIVVNFINFAPFLSFSILSNLKQSSHHRMLKFGLNI